MDTTDGTSQDTGSEALNLRQAAEAIANQLAPQGDSEGEALTGEEPEAFEEEGDQPDADEEQSDTEEGDAKQTAELADDLTVKVGDAEVTLHELKRGFLREQDYTRKTMEVAEVRKGLEAEKSTTAQERERYADAIARLDTFLAGMDEEDLSDLRHTDPAEYAARMADRQARQGQRARIAEEQSRIAAEKTKEQHAQLTQAINDRDAKLLEAVPDWKDEGKLKADLTRILGYAESIGVRADDVLGLTDHRIFLALKDAAAWRDLQAKKADVQRKVSEAPKPAKPGATPVRVVSDVTRSKQRLAKTGRVQDAAEALMHIL